MSWAGFKLMLPFVSEHVLLTNLAPTSLPFLKKNQFDSFRKALKLFSCFEKNNLGSWIDCPANTFSLIIIPGHGWQAHLLSFLFHFPPLFHQLQKDVLIWSKKCNKLSCMLWVVLLISCVISASVDRRRALSPLFYSACMWLNQACRWNGLWERWKSSRNCIAII